ncbi:MAG: efflux RND transporter permease subunit [Deltaproteobacteria bacterium]|nr:efflux RND transporter permease subunit [Deltaproteobacteria bacterium]MBK8236825.1 efflux RND transporter permease subunit [Deltaproteobacteria bacterium]MBK8719031.1 efflux RND transporter permease subunit [Deltaproteobacteria bacterium]MBP7287948.1 efflux RND transporter permease subunit [Nannocystaceae bacterium]
MLPGFADNHLVRTALRRPIAVVMVLLSALVLGVIALGRMPLELIPSGFSAPFLSVSVTYPDATARDVEEKITKPLEGAVATTPGIDRIISNSNSGSSQIMIVFAGEVDMDVAYRQVRDRINRVRGDLPTEVKEIRIRKESGESLPVAFYGVVWDEELADPMTVIDEHLVRPIERIDGVGLVNMWGRVDPQVQIDVDRPASEAAGINMVNLVGALVRANFTLASGQIREGGDTLLLRSQAAFTSPEEIGEIMIRADGLRLRDVATVTLGPPPVTRYDRYNGKPATVMFVIKESQANTVEICDRVKAAVAEAVAHPDLQGVQVDAVFVQGDMIRYSLDQVVGSGVQGGWLALAVLLFFLRRLLITIVIALSIPLSLFLALPVMYFTGQSINMVSLVGLMICVGLVVDNAVVVAENVARYRRRGLGPYAAALQGAGEVALAMTLATLTTVIVFLPAALLSEGPTQFFMVRMVTPVCISLLASLFVALVLVPLASATMLADDGVATPRGGTFARVVATIDRGLERVLGRIYDATLAPLNDAYGRLLRVVLRRRMDVIAVSLLALASTAIPFMNVQCASGQQFGSRRITINYSMPAEVTLDEANAFFLGIEEQLRTEGRELRVAGQYIGFDENTGTVQVFFDPPSPDEPPFEEFAKALADTLPTKPGWRKTSQFGESDGARDDAFRVSIYGDDHDLLADTRDALQERLLQVEGVLGVRGSEDTRRRDELALSVDRGMSERFGVSADALANTVAYAIRGAPLPRFHTPAKELEVRVRYREDDRKSVDAILGWEVPTREGGSVPISVLAEKTTARGEASLQRVNKRVGTAIRLELANDDRAETIARIRQVIAEYRLPEGLSFEADGEATAINDMARDLIGAMGLGTIFIFLVMGFLFESFVLPLAVLPAIPLSFVGVWWFLYATGAHIDPLAGIGIVLLLGVVVNNAIVLIDFVNVARKQGLSREEAIVQAGRLRFRPILMTSLTTIGGLLPLALTEPTGEGIAYQAFGQALLGGMTTATVLTLVVVPVTYCYLDDLRDTMALWWRRIVALGRRR